MRRCSAIDETIVITLPDNLPRGTQIVSYRVISADGHPVGGIDGVFDRHADGDSGGAGRQRRPGSPA